MLNNKVILITGGTGSFGKKFTKRVNQKMWLRKKSNTKLYMILFSLRHMGSKSEQQFQQKSIF